MADGIKRLLTLSGLGFASLLGALVLATSPAALAQEQPQEQVQAQEPAQAQAPAEQRPFEIYARCLATTEVFLMDTRIAVRLRRDLDVPPRRRLDEMVALFTGALEASEGSPEEKEVFLASVRTSFSNVMSGMGAVAFMPAAHRSLIGPCSTLAERIEQQDRDQNG